MATTMEETASRTVRILWIRHGETADNARQVIQGHIDTALNTQGIRQAEATRDFLKNTHVDVCFSSDLHRAKRTAEIIMEGHANSPGVIVDDRVKEKYLGVLEGTEYYKPHPPNALDTIEPMKHFQTRLLSFFDSLFPLRGTKSILPDTEKDLVVLVVSHGGPIKVLLPLLWKERSIVWTPEAEEKAKAAKYLVLNCSISETMMHQNQNAAPGSKNGWNGTVRSFADVSHLAGTTAGPRAGTAADADLADDAKKEAIRQYQADTTVQ